MREILAVSTVRLGMDELRQDHERDSEHSFCENSRMITCEASLALVKGLEL